MDKQNNPEILVSYKGIAIHIKDYEANKENLTQFSFGVAHIISVQSKITDKSEWNTNCNIIIAAMKLMKLALIKGMWLKWTTNQKLKKY